MNSFELPNLPTDNLYKFMALSGILLSITSYVLFFSVFHFVLDNSLELRIDQNKLKFDQNILNNELDLLNRETSIAATLVEKGDIDTIESSQLIAKIQKEMLSIFEKSKSVDLSLSNFDARASVIDIYNKEENLAIDVMKFFSCFGFLISFLGFILWYAKLQRYQDQILAGEADKNKGKKRNNIVK